ncbi:MAG TPA: serine/threonine-protein kinase [Kofleriaceae bacterium]|nr:serine/threonine-protein kinase [Kofleriaceae bacterium]
MDGAAGSRTLSGGTMLDDKYRIERLLAAGGMGAVYLGTHTKLRKRVAIKVLNPQLSTAPMVERFHREAITASQIGHEGIAQVTDLGTSSEGEPFLVMEYLEGESLAARLKESGPLAVEDACEMGCSILSPLAAAHQAGIVHRDLKPDNVFLVRQSRGEMVKLLDFGISRSSGVDPSFRLTMTGLVLGTPYYMSPEQARGESAITPAADLYAFGVMLYEMLIGDVPIRAENYNQLMYRVTIGDFSRPRELRPDLPEEIDRIILHSMAQAPQDRPASASELERALLPYCRPVFRAHASGKISSPGLPPRSLFGTDPHGNVKVDRARFAGPTVSDSDPYPLVPPRDTLQDSALSALTAGSELELDPQERPTDIVAVPDDLEDAIAPASPPIVYARAAPVEPEPPVAPPRRSRALRIVVPVAMLAAGAAAAAIVVVVTGSSSARSPAAPPGVPAASPAPAAVATALATSTASPPSPPSPPVAARTITLRFEIDPRDAAIVLDGKRVTEPELAVTMDTAPHLLQITAAGFASHLGTLTYNESQRVVVQLKPTGAERGKGARVDRMRPGRPERPDRPERTDRPERAERTDRTKPAEHKADRADRIENQSPYE